MKFIENSNKILFFTVAILMISIAAFQIISNMFRDDYQRPAVVIIESDEVDENQIMTYKKKYLGLIRDAYIFELTADKVIKEKGYIIGMASRRNSTWCLNNNTINMMFSKEGEANKLLLDTHALIIDFSPFQVDKGEVTLSKNLYIIVKQDTNNDGLLDNRDTKDFLISDYDGANLRSILSDITSYEVIEDDKVLINKMSKEISEYYLYNIAVDKLFQLDTSL
jgi:hypothetical protein